METAIAVEGLTKRFGSVTAVEGLTFGVRPGAITGFLGPNGAGKTTSLRMILGLATPTAGTVLIRGRPYGQLDRPASEVGAALERAGFHPGRSGRDHLRALCASADLPASRADEVLRFVDLEEARDRRVKGYSLGMRQRLALGAALLGDPAVLVLDEPANGLDPQGIRWLRDLMRRLADEGRTVLVSSHVLAEVAQTADDVLVIAKGRLVESGPISRLTQGGSTAVVVRSADDGRLAEALRGAGAEVEPKDGWMRVRDLGVERVGESALGAGVALHELYAEKASLEDVFLSLTGEEQAP